MAYQFFTSEFFPDSFHRMPGGALRYKSYNNSNVFNTVASGYTAFVLNQSYFQNVANITTIEFVPMSKGSLIIEVINFDGSLNINKTGLQLVEPPTLGFRIAKEKIRQFKKPKRFKS